MASEGDDQVTVSKSELLGVVNEMRRVIHRITPVVTTEAGKLLRCAQKIEDMAEYKP